MIQFFKGVFDHSVYIFLNKLSIHFYSSNDFFECLKSPLTNRYEQLFIYGLEPDCKMKMTILPMYAKIHIYFLICGFK